MSGIGGHTKPNRGGSDDWLTPPEVVEALGPFDLDPCASIAQPWKTATTHYTIEDDGLVLPWSGFVWCNPPYGPQTWRWLEKLHHHNDGIALTFARTETDGFFRQVWGKADAVLFLRKRLFFHHPVTGVRAAHNSGGPSVLIGYGATAVERLRYSKLAGAYVWDWDDA